MILKKIGLNHKGKKIFLDVFDCNKFERGRGLMFCQKKNAKILMFDLKKPSRKAIHSFFVFFNFVAVWCDEKDKVLEVKIIHSFNPLINPKIRWTKLIEIPISQKYRKEIKLLCS